jgi:hypothetical protein
VAVRLVVGARRRSPALWMLGIGTCALLATDAVYGWALLHGGYETGGLLDGGWAIFYALFGAAALYPPLTDVVRRAPEPDERLTAGRLALLAVASLVGPAVIVVRALLGQPLDVAVLTIASAVMFSLVVVRMAGLVPRHEEALRREAALRAASEALVGAAGCAG